MLSKQETATNTDTGEDLSAERPGSTLHISSRWWHNPACSHTALRGEIHSNGSVWRGRGALLWNEIWDMRITRNYSQSQLVTNHPPLSHNYTWAGVSCNQFLHQLSFNRSGQFTIIPGLGEILACTLQFGKIWTADTRKSSSAVSLSNKLFYSFRNISEISNPQIYKINSINTFRFW